LYLNVRLGARPVSSVTVNGTVAGPVPSVPAIAVARSCCTVPITSPIVAILNDDIRLGSEVYTVARVIGKAVGPKLKKGCPKA
jgi:hypothetical protein